MSWRFLVWYGGAHGRALVEVALISSSKELNDAKISGVIEASVRVRSSVVYFYLNSFGKSSLISCSHIKTIKFSNVGVSSSSSSTFST